MLQYSFADRSESVYVLGVHTVCDMCSSGFLLIRNRIGYFGGREEGLDIPCEVWRVEALKKEGPWRTANRLLKVEEATMWVGESWGMLEWDGMNAPDCERWNIQLVGGGWVTLFCSVPVCFPQSSHKHLSFERLCEKGGYERKRNGKE